MPRRQNIGPQIPPSSATGEFGGPSKTFSLPHSYILCFQLQKTAKPTLHKRLTVEEPKEPVIIEIVMPPAKKVSALDSSSDDDDDDLPLSVVFPPQFV